MAHADPFDLASLEVRISELLVATADGHDPELDRSISDVLQTLRRQLRMDVVFVSEFVDGQRVFRFMRGGEAMALHEGDAAPLESSYCHLVVQGRMAELVPDAAALVARGELPDTGLPIGAHLSTPVVLPDGRIYGTVCCFSATPNADLHHSALACLRQCARLVARRVEVAPHHGFAPTEPAPFPEITG
jgi:GAF domain-containing protein